MILYFRGFAKKLRLLRTKYVLGPRLLSYVQLYNVLRNSVARRTVASVRLFSV